MNLTPTPPPSTSALSAPRRTSSADSPDAPADARDARQDRDEPDWQRAYQRRRTQDDETPGGNGDPQPGLPAALPWAPHEPAQELAPLQALAAAGPTVERIAALRQAADAQAAAVPAERSWQVELPAAHGAGWQLHVQQAQPLAPLTVELRVPPVAQAQARQQLGDLDKRLRDAGHDVLRARLRDPLRTDKRSLPVDEVQP